MFSAAVAAWPQNSQLLKETHFNCIDMLALSPESVSVHDTEHSQAIAWLRGARPISSNDALSAPEDLKTWLHLTTSVTKKLQQTFQLNQG